ncbi:MAG: sulfite exporter TauE/SafE family protein [Akkermansiaceae bacterium]
MDPVQTTVGALVAGLVTSVHCVGMCGPIACGLSAMPATETQRLIATTSYHLSRLAAYGTIGAICGAIGRQPLEWFFSSPAALLPWVLVVVFLIFGFGLEKKLPRPPSLMKWTAKMRFRLGRLSPIRSGIALGSLTPLLPCGPLYLLFGASLLTGSAMRGAEFALAFGLGTVPLLWIAQQSFRHIGKRFNLVPIQRTFAIAAACLIAFRLWGTLPFSQSPTDTKSDLPSCCH